VETIAAVSRGWTEAGAVPLEVGVEDLFRAHYTRLVRALTLVSGSQESAADAVQEAFVKAHLHWRKIRGYDDPVGWIRRVAINRLRDDHRRATRKERAEQRLTTEAGVVGAQWAADGQAERGLGDLGPLLATLPRQQRLCLALYYVDGLSVAEVATTLGISDGAVKFHLHQGRERLRAAHDRSQEDN